MMKLYRKSDIFLRFLKIILYIFLTIKKKQTSFQKVKKGCIWFAYTNEIEQMNLVKNIENNETNIFLEKGTNTDDFQFKIRKEVIYKKAIGTKQSFKSRLSEKFLDLFNQKRHQMRFLLKNTLTCLCHSMMLSVYLSEYRTRPKSKILLLVSKKKFNILTQLNLKIWFKNSNINDFFKKDKIFSIIQRLHKCKIIIISTVFFRIENDLLTFKTFNFNYRFNKEKFITDSESHLKIRYEKTEKNCEVDLILIKNFKREKIKKYILRIKKIFGLFKLKHYIFLFQIKKLIDKLSIFLKIFTPVARNVNKKEKFAQHYLT